ncbi:DUF1206 domain-containing protein [Pseudalkalibacillus caeni]|uniref:DUF1206 domain-containing protein n=1 Tax=Exobacillus caeni TaxID=2574798 RepID=A0A5R9F8I5_9BACL|nr:DUF1206 domain-containing protein [Pseudalkalibacillus caeni]TLS37938.1 DUF1206 domain-containing protein [Pseudalkalibacillus caeni]
MDKAIAKQEAKDKAKEAHDKAKPWVKKFARFGYAAKGVVYILIGILSLMAALGVGGKTTGSKGAFASVASKPFGEVLLWIVGIGLVGYVIWRIYQVIADPGHKEVNMKSIVIRIGYAISAGIYGFLAYKAIMIAIHAASGSSGSKKTVTAKMMAQPFGQWVIGLVGAGILIFGLYEFYKAFKEKFKEKLKKGEMSQAEVKWATIAGKVGLSARGVTFVIIGFFLIQTAYTADPNKTKGLDGALSKIAEQPFGQWMLGIVAAGLLFYGIFMVFKAKYRRINFSS